MMDCYEEFFLYTMLFPIASASPILFALISVAIYVNLRPCLPCIAKILLLAGLLVPLLSTSPPPDPLRNSISNLTDPIPGRGVLSWNNGRLFDPVLKGYRMMDTLPDEGGFDGSTGSGEEGEGSEGWAYTISSLFRQSQTQSQPSNIDSNPQNPTQPNNDNPEPPLPAGYIDLRYYGLGVVLDLGWRRSEEGLRFEMDDWRRNSPPPPVPIAPSHSDEREQQGVDLDVGTAGGEEPRSGYRWGGVPFFGNW